MKGIIYILMVFLLISFSSITRGETGEKNSAMTEEDGATESTVTEVSPENNGVIFFDIEPRLQSVNLESLSSKAVEYRALPEGLYIDRALFYYGLHEEEFRMELKRLYPLTNMVEDGYGELSFRKYGLLNVDLSLARFPHTYSATIPSLSTGQDKQTLSLRFTPGDRLVVSGYISIMDKKGKKPFTVEHFTGLTDNPTGILEIARPVDFSSTNISLGLEYFDEVFDIQMENNVQIFSTNLSDEFQWNNPFINGTTGRAKVEDDFTVHTLYFRPSIRFTENVKLLNTVSYSKVTSNIGLVPFTTIPGVGQDLSGTTLDTDVRNLSYSSRLFMRPSSGVNVSISYRFHEYDNDTPIIDNPPPYVMIDGDASAIRYPRIPRYARFKTGTIGIKGAWSISRELTIDAGIEDKDTRRGEREVTEEDERKIFVTFISNPSYKLGGRLRYTFTRRKGDYNPSYYDLIYDPDNNAVQHQLMRAFDLSSMGTHGLHLAVNYQPMDILSLESIFTFGKAVHHDTSIGRTDYLNKGTTLSVSLEPREYIRFYGEFDYDIREIRGNYAWSYDSSLSYPQDPAYPDFTVPVGERLKDIWNGYVIGISLNNDAGFFFDTSYRNYDLSETSINLPDVTSVTEVYEITLSYTLPGSTEYAARVVKDVRIRMGYYAERYRRNDFMLDSFPASGTDVFLGIREPAYKLDIFYGGLSLYF